MAINPATGREAQEISSVFGGERETPHAVFQQQRSSIVSTTSSLPRNNDCGLECPRCGNGVRLFTRAGEPGYHCLNGHKWMGQDELMNENPKKLEFKMTPARQEGHIKMPISVPQTLKELLEKKFGTRLEATIANVLDVLSGPKFMILTEEDLRQIEIHTGQEIKNPASIVGQIYASKDRAIQDEATIKTLRNSLQSRVARGGAAITDATMVLELGDELANSVREKAESKGMSPDDYVRTAATLAVEGDWV